jgi:hypothetical protein
MQIPIVTDLLNDKSLKKSLLRIGLFLVVVIILDYFVSVILLRGIEMNYGLKSDSEILLIGHSHLMLALDKELLEQHSRMKVAKYTREGVNVSDRNVMIRHYFNTCTKKPEIVILGIDPWLFAAEGLSNNSYLLFLPFMDTPEVRDFIKESVPQKIDYLKAKWIRSTRFNSTLINASIRGYLKNWDNLKIGVLDTVMLKHEIANGSYRAITFNHDLMIDFSNTLQFLKEENVRVILLNTPVYKPVIAVQNDQYQVAMQKIDSIAQASYPEASFVDLVTVFSDKSSLFFDPIHLNPVGQKVITEYFSKVLDSVINNQGRGER